MPPPKADRTAIRIEAMQALYAAGWNPNRIATAFGLDRAGVAYHVVPGQKERVTNNVRRWVRSLPPDKRAELSYRRKLRECRIENPAN